MYFSMEVLCASLCTATVLQTLGGSDEPFPKSLGLRQHWYTGGRCQAKSYFYFDQSVFDCNRLFVCCRYDAAAYTVTAASQSVNLTIVCCSSSLTDSVIPSL